MHLKDGSTGDRRENAVANENMVTDINFVDVCCQQTAYMDGHSDIIEDIRLIKASE